MNRLFKQLVISLTVLFTIQAQAMNVVELKQKNSNKVVVVIRFENGSIADPADKAGLTFATASMMAEGGAGGMSYADIQDKMHPWAAAYNVSIDKQVSTFTFQVPVDFVDEFYPLIKNAILAPDFSEKDFSRVMKGQQNYVDQVVRASSDEEYSKYALEHQLFRGGNMQHLKQGTSASVKTISLDDIESHYQNAFTRHNVMLGIAGNYSDELLNKLRQTWQNSRAKLSQHPHPPRRDRLMESRLKSFPRKMLSALRFSLVRRWVLPALTMNLPP